MKFEKIHNKGQARIFKNRYLELLTRTHPLIIWVMYLPFLILFPYYSFSTLHFSGLKIFLLYFTGVFTWTLIEYLLHRFVLHYQPESATGKRINYVFHGNHHEFPRDKARLFMPAIPSLALAVIFFSTFYLILGNNVFSFFPGILLGYLMYGTMHFAIHAWNPPFRWMKGLWRNHHLHHYKHTDMGFGVSSTLWDHVFGTMFDLKNEPEDKEKEFSFTKSHKSKQKAS